MGIYRRYGFVLLALGALLLTMAPAQAQKGNNGNPGVLPPGATVNGMTYGEWGAQWWTWISQVPASQNPLADDTGVNALSGQSGEVYFLVGAFGSGPVERTITLPPGKKLFFPILNWAYFSFPTDPLPWPTGQDLLNLVGTPSPDRIRNLFVTVDNRDLVALDRYFAVSPMFEVPDVAVDNLYGIPPEALAPTQSFTNSMTTGYWIMVVPLPPGEHTVRFGGEVLAAPGSDVVSFWLEVTYHITVEAGKK